MRTYSETAKKAINDLIRSHDEGWNERWILFHAIAEIANMRIETDSDITTVIAIATKAMEDCS